jgi:hypothetical protein
MLSDTQLLERKQLPDLAAASSCFSGQRGQHRRKSERLAHKKSKSFSLGSG